VAELQRREKFSCKKIFYAKIGAQIGKNEI
jgi:hypothetical protein